MKKIVLFFLYCIVVTYCNLSKYLNFRYKQPRNLQDDCLSSIDQIPFQILSYENNNNILKIIYISPFTHNTTVKVSLTNTYQETFDMNCNIYNGSNSLLCEFTYEIGIPPGIFNSILVHQFDNCNEAKISNIIVYLSQTSKYDKQMVVKSTSFENDICRGLDSFELFLENVYISDEITGFLSGESYQSSISFKCSPIKNESINSLTCTPNSEQNINKYYAVSTLYYTNITRQFAFIETKKYVQFNSNYNPLDKENTELIQNISKNTNAIVNLTFKKAIPESTIYFIDKNTIPIIFSQNPSNNKNLYKSNIDSLSEGSYQLAYDNACGKRENLGVTVNIGVSLVLNYPDFSSIKEQCITKLNNFTITTNNNEEDTTSIKGELKSTKGDIISFSCDNVSSKSGSKQIINCNASDTQISGTYYISSVQYSASNSGTALKSAYFVGEGNTTIYINSDYNPMESRKAEGKEINYGTSSSFTIEFSKVLSSVPKVTLLEKNVAVPNSDIPLTCTINGNNCICDIKDPTVVLPNKEFLVNVENSCGLVETANFTIKTAVMVLGTVNFKEEEKSCTNNISTFNISIIKNQVNTTKITGSLKSETNHEIYFNCNNIKSISEQLVCTINNNQNPQNSHYFLNEVKYTPSGKQEVYQEFIAMITDNKTSIYYHDKYNSIITNPQIESIIISDKQNEVNLTFKNPLLASVSINFIEKTSKWNKTINCEISLEKKATCTITNNLLPRGTYILEYVNECKISQNPNIEVIVEEKPSINQIELGKPSFENNKCTNTFPSSFTIEIINKTYILSEIKGEVIKDDNPDIRKQFTCDNTIKDAETLTCSFTRGSQVSEESQENQEIQEDGRYVLYEVNFTSDNDTISNTAFLQDKTSYILYHSQYVNYLPKGNPKQYITDKTSQKISINFEGKSGIKQIFLKNSLEEFNGDCVPNLTDDTTLDCSVSQVPDGVYNVLYDNVCGIRTTTDTQAFISPNIIFGSPQFSSTSCSNSIGNISIPILNDNKVITSENVTVTLVHTIDKDQKISLACTGQGSHIACQNTQTATLSADGSYVLSEIIYDENGINYSGTITDIVTSVEYKSNYAALGTNELTQKVNFITRRKLIILFEKNLQSTFPVMLNNTNNTSGIVLNNCSYSSNELTCVLNETQFSTNSTYSVYYTNACGVQENTKIQLQVEIIPPSASYTTNSSLNINQSQFFDPRYDHSNKLRLWPLFLLFLLLV